jgi:catechol 2,3-dioxygenase-like lactoylglutathione lyase family enzyme
MAKIKKVGYVVLGVWDPQRSFAFYTETLGIELVDDGNRLEIFSQEMTPADGEQFLHDARAVAHVMRPLALETATR